MASSLISSIKILGAAVTLLSSNRRFSAAAKFWRLSFPFWKMTNYKISSFIASYFLLTLTGYTCLANIIRIKSLNSANSFRQTHTILIAELDEFINDALK